MISKNYSNILVAKLFTPFFVPFALVIVIRFDLKLNEGALSPLNERTLSPLVTSALLTTSSLFKPHKLPQLSE